MIEVVRKVAGGEVFVGQELMPYLVKARSSVDGDPLAELTPREFEVFMLLADSKSVNDIAELLSLALKQLVTTRPVLKINWMFQILRA